MTDQTGDEGYEPFIAAEGWREDTSIRYVPECALAAAVALERSLLTEAERALTKAWKAMLTVKPTLAVPYQDAPETSPWAKFAGPAARTAHDVSMKIRKRLKDTP